MPGSPGRRPGVDLTQELADKLRELIHISGDWWHGHELPEGKLMAEYGVSRTTVRRALDVMANEGVIDRGQGRVARVCIRDPLYHLVFEQQPSYGMAELSPNHGSQQGMAERTCHEDVIAVPRGYAHLLGFESRRPVMRERTIRLFMNGEPLLISRSYLPTDITDEGKGWQDVEIGQLALTGYDVRADIMDDYERMPARSERAALGMPKDVLMKVIYRPCQVRMPDWTAQAGVVVLARTDKVRSRRYGPIRLTLE